MQWLNDWLVDWMTDWLVDWLVYSWANCLYIYIYINISWWCTINSWDINEILMECINQVKFCLLQPTIFQCGMLMGFKQPFYWGFSINDMDLLWNSDIWWWNTTKKALGIATDNGDVLVHNGSKMGGHCLTWRFLWKVSAENQKLQILAIRATINLHENYLSSKTISDYIHENFMPWSKLYADFSAWRGRSVVEVVDSVHRDVPV